MEEGHYRSPFGYILVDEFQDISPSRARLLKALLDSSPKAQLFAVGDDWQAIFRFGGSDIAVMREFGVHFGPFERIDLTTTFRCADRIAGVATDFVLRNPAQIRKTVRATRKADRPRYTSDSRRAGTLASERGARPDRERRPPATTARRGADTGPLPVSAAAQSARAAEAVSRPSLHLDDRAPLEGLEADYAVVLGLRSGKHGFPVEIADDPLLDLVLAVPESHPNAEERRLLYVAITRARRQVYLLADGGPPSEFVTELIDEGYDVEVFAPSSGGRRVLSAMHRRDGSSDARTPAAEASSTAARISRCANTRRVPVPAAATAFP